MVTCMRRCTPFTTPHVYTSKCCIFLYFYCALGFCFLFGFTLESHRNWRCISVAAGPSMISLVYMVALCFGVNSYCVPEALYVISLFTSVGIKCTSAVWWVRTFVPVTCSYLSKPLFFPPPPSPWNETWTTGLSSMKVNTVKGWTLQGTNCACSVLETWRPRGLVGLF